jgi:hypothetical protein
MPKVGKKKFPYTKKGKKDATKAKSTAKKGKKPFFLYKKAKKKKK